MTSNEEQPTIYVIGGPNGVGKTTFANEFLTRYVRCNEFLNADLIAWKYLMDHVGNDSRMRQEQNNDTK